MKEGRFTRAMLIHVIFAFLCILCSINIFFFSNQPADDSYELTGSVVTAFTQEPTTQDDWDLRAEMVMFIRKFAHALIYFVLGCFLRILLETSPCLRKKREFSRIGYYYIIITIHACLDEFHQLFVEGRGASIIDVVIDISGATIGLGVVIMLERALCRKRGKKQNENCM